MPNSAQRILDLEKEAMELEKRQAEIRKEALQHLILMIEEDQEILSSLDWKVINAIKEAGFNFIEISALLEETKNEILCKALSLLGRKSQFLPSQFFGCDILVSKTCIILRAKTLKQIRDLVEKHKLQVIPEHRIYLKEPYKHIKVSVVFESSNKSEAINMLEQYRHKVCGDIVQTGIALCDGNEILQKMELDDLRLDSWLVADQEDDEITLRAEFSAMALSWEFVSRLFQNHMQSVSDKVLAAFDETLVDLRRSDWNMDVY